MSKNEKAAVRKIEVKEGWFYEVSTRALRYVPRQWIDEAKQFEKANSGEGTLQVPLTIPYVAYESLLEYIAKNEKGVLRTDRDEDLKLINRLLDVLTKEIEAKKN